MSWLRDGRSKWQSSGRHEMCGSMPLAMLGVGVACASLYIMSLPDSFSSLLRSALGSALVSYFLYSDSTAFPTRQVVRVYTLTRMVKQHPPERPCLTKPRINAIKGRKGCRVFDGKKYVGCFRSKKAANKFIREKTTSGDQLVEHEPGPKPYKYVRGKSTKRKTVYYGVMRVPGQRAKEWTKKYFPRCESPKAAANMVAEYLQTTAENIKVSKCEWQSPAQSTERVAFLSEVFHGWVPADLAGAVSFRGQASSLQTFGPAAYVAGLLGKEDRWRHGMLKIWDRMPLAERSKLHGLGSRDEDMVRDGARALHDLLSLSFALWAGWSIPRLRSMSWPVDVMQAIVPPTPAQQAHIVEERQWWKRHVHRNVIHHFSIGPFAQQLGIIQKTTKRVGSLLMGNDEGEYYCITAFDAAVHVKTYETLHSMGVVLNSLRVPRTNVEWAQAQADAEALSDRLKIKRSQYRWPWLLRTYIIAEMRHAGVNSLKIVEDWTSEQLQGAIRPDQNEWVAKWMFGLAGNSLKKLLRILRFTEPLEMLSVYVCIMNDSSIMAYPLKQLKERVDDITKARCQMRRQNGQEASPALVVKSVMDAV